MVFKPADLRGFRNFADMKALLRAAEARFHDALFQSISQVLAAITPDDAKNWFTHSGYCLG